MAMAWAHLTSSGVQNGVRGWRLEWRGVRSSSASSELPGGRERGRERRSKARIHSRQSVASINVTSAELEHAIHSRKLTSVKLFLTVNLCY